MKKSILFRKLQAAGIFFGVVAFYAFAHKVGGASALFTVLSLIFLWFPYMLPNEEKYKQDS